MKNRAFATLISTCLGIGYVRLAPGTFGSFFAVLFWWILLMKVPLIIYASAIVVLCLVGIWAIGEYTRRQSKKDPGEIVIDEWVGMGIAMMVCEPRIIEVGIAFVLFRIFDIWKPWGVSYFDRQTTPSAVMLDDVVAGLYAAVSIVILKWAWLQWV